jgi:serine/threonine protein kinase
VSRNFGVFQGAQLGQAGGFGKAFRATHRATGRLCAVKVLEKKKILKHMFQNECDLMAKVNSRNNPYIIVFHEAFEDKKLYYMVMECALGGYVGLPHFF